MEANGYLTVTSDKTIIFMKREGRHFIVHGLFVDDMMHIATYNKLKNKFMEKYSRDFTITGAGFMKTILGMEIELSNRSIKLHLDLYVCEMLNEYKGYIKKSQRPNRVQIAPAVILPSEDSPMLPDPSKQKLLLPSFNSCFADSLRYLFCTITVSLILCFCNPLGSNT
jgi:hypothetical protein